MISQPHICILTSQYFGWGVYGGFGSMARKLSESLARAGYAVTVIVPRRKGQPPRETLNGVDVQSFAPLDIAAACQLVRQSQADIFHSQDPTLLTFLAQRLCPNRIHLVTCRDPRGWKDWLIEFRYATNRRRVLMPFHVMTESGIPVNQSVRNAHAVFCPAHFLKPKIMRLYRLKNAPEFLPNLIDIPEAIPPKGERPTFTFIARWDKRKRPWLFLDLAKQFPDYEFIAVGKGTASAESEFDAWLRQHYRGIDNLEMTGFINRFTEPERLQRILSKTWALVNTAAREGLPLTFLEAAAFGCSIISAVDPDGFASRFGVQAKNDDFASAIKALLKMPPLEKGRQAHDYVRETYETSRALQAHITQYLKYCR